MNWGTGVGEAQDVISIEIEYLKLEPIGTFFMIAFILIMAVQFTGMILHRLMTLSHIVATENKIFNVDDPNLQNG